MLEVIWNMETADPDDFLTLLLLLGHPKVSLKAVTVHPGTREQVGLVSQALSWFGRSIPVGGYDPDRPKKCVSSWHYSAFSNLRPLAIEGVSLGGDVLRISSGPDVTLISGAALSSFRQAGGVPLKQCFIQGGFAGEGVVPRDLQLPKFAGKTAVPSFNLDGDRPAVQELLASKVVGPRHFVSKNVCHGVVYDRAIHERVGQVKDRSLSLSLIYRGMDYYLGRGKGGKALHDPLAACCAIDPTIAQWSEVEMTRSREGWTSKLAPGSGTWVITSYDHEKFLKVFLDS